MIDDDFGASTPLSAGTKIKMDSPPVRKPSAAGMPTKTEFTPRLPPGIPRIGGSNPPSPYGKLEPQYSDAYKAWKENPTPDSRSDLLQLAQPVIDTALRSYGADSPVMRGRAKLMAAKALDSYDPSRGNLKTHLLSQLVGLQRHNAQAQNVISVPEQVALDRLQLQKTERQLSDDLGRDPSDMEIADATGMSMKRIGYVRQYRPPVISSQFTSTDGESGEQEEFDPGSKSLAHDDGQDAWLEFVYADLHPTDQAIMDLSLGLHGSPIVKSKEIARRLGITPGAVSQRAARLQGMLDERSSHGLF